MKITIASVIKGKRVSICVFPEKNGIFNARRFHVLHFKVAAKCLVVGKVAKAWRDASCAEFLKTLSAPHSLWKRLPVLEGCVRNEVHRMWLSGS